VYSARYQPSFIAITESWSNENTPDHVYKLDNFCLYRKDRENQIGGGLLLYVRECLKSALNDFTNAEYDESLWCNIWFKNGGNVLVGVIYRPPGTSFAKNQQWWQCFSRSDLSTSWNLICKKSACSKRQHLLKAHTS